MMSDAAKKSALVEAGGTFQGKRELLEHLKGKRLTASQAIAAHCYECCGFFDQGRFDCKTATCSLYPFNPHREGGRVKRREVSEETRFKLAETMKKKRSKGS